MMWWQALQDPNTQWVLAGCILLGLSSGVLGCFAFLRNRSLMGDALAHAALPGVCFMYLLTGSKSIGLFLIGAAIAGLAATFCISAISRHTKIKEDTALALTLSVFFGFGIVLLTFIQHSDSGNQSGLDKFLFGQAASLVGSDVTTMIVVSSFLLIVTSLLFKEFKLLSFDPGYGRGLGFPMGFLDTLLMAMLLLAVVIGLQAVGVVLMAAMLIAPSVTARYWTDKLDVMVVISGVFGALSGALGTLFSTQVENLPTGPMIVLSATFFFLISLLFSPRRGLLSRFIRFLKLRRRVLLEGIMEALYDCSEHHYKLNPTNPVRAFGMEDISLKSGKSLRAVQRGLHLLEKQGMVERRQQDTFTFTLKGIAYAYEIVLNQRLWDLYHMNEDTYQGFGIDKDNEQIVPQLSAEDYEQMMQHLAEYNLVPLLNKKSLSSPQVFVKSNQGRLSI